jgi:hypothetical protein
MVAEQDAPLMFPSAFVLDPHYPLNQLKDGLHGYNFSQPLHFKLPFEHIERTPYDLRLFTHISMKVTCGMCFHLTCCNGVSSGALNADGKYHASHKKGCPLVLALRRFTFQQLLDLNHASTGTYTDDLSRSYQETFHIRKDVERMAKDSLFPHADTHVLETLMIANYMRYNLYRDENNQFEEFTHLWVDSDSDTDDENDIFTPDRHLPPLYRFGIQRICTPCMNQRCPFFANCCIRNHYSNHVLYTHPGAMPPSPYMCCARANCRCDDA